MRKQVRETGYVPSEAMHQLLLSNSEGAATHASSALGGTLGGALDGRGAGTRRADGREHGKVRLPHMLHNVGVWGARLSTFGSTVRSMATSTRKHYDLRPTAGDALPRHVLDMVIFHEAVLHHAAGGGTLLRGWPHGPVNVPFWGENCGAAAYFCRSLGTAAAVVELRRRVLDHSTDNGYLPAINRSAERPRCDMGDFLGALEAQAFFAHKVGCGRTIRC